MQRKQIKTHNRQRKAADAGNRNGRGLKCRNRRMQNVIHRFSHARVGLCRDGHADGAGRVHCHGSLYASGRFAAVGNADCKRARCARPVQARRCIPGRLHRVERICRNACVLPERLRCAYSCVQRVSASVDINTVNVPDNFIAQNALCLRTQRRDHFPDQRRVGKRLFEHVVFCHHVVLPQILVAGSAARRASACLRNAASMRGGTPHCSMMNDAETAAQRAA